MKKLKASMFALALIASTSVMAVSAPETVDGNSNAGAAGHNNYSIWIESQSKGEIAISFTGKSRRWWCLWLCKA